MSDQPSRRKAVIFDLDGTLANLNGRKPYGSTVRDNCPNDLCIEPIAEIARLYIQQEEKAVIIVSGRSETAIVETQKWLYRHHIFYDALFMRKEGDFRDDRIVKEEMYREEIEPKYDVILVFDDRPKVVRHWREMGLLVADVGKGVEF